MKVKTPQVQEDPETKARRLAEESRAETARTNATQRLLDRQTRRTMRLFGARQAMAFGGGPGSQPSVPDITFFNNTISPGGYMGGVGGGGGGIFGGYGDASIY